MTDATRPTSVLYMRRGDGGRRRLGTTALTPARAASGPASAAWLSPVLVRRASQAVLFAFRSSRVLSLLRLSLPPALSRRYERRPAGRACRQGLLLSRGGTYCAVRRRRLLPLTDPHCSGAQDPRLLGRDRRVQDAAEAHGGPAGVRSPRLLPPAAAPSRVRLTAALPARYVFYDGPPFATGLPHYGHILAGTIKARSALASLCRSPLSDAFNSRRTLLRATPAPPASTWPGASAGTATDCPWSTRSTKRSVRPRLPLTASA